MPAPTLRDRCFEQLDKLIPQYSNCTPQRLIVGFSGGLDSTVLLKMLAEYCHQQHSKGAYILEAVHVNHQLSSNADSWQSHCEAICARYSVPLTASLVSVVAKGKGVESAARDARYQAFQDLCGSDAILLLGHHLDDQSETLLMRLMRGSGPLGLSAMNETTEHSGVPVIRPLLSESREALEQYAQRHSLSWVNDESNADSSFDRNFLRNEVLPLLKQRWPGLLPSVARSARLCHESVCLADELAEQDAVQRCDEDGRVDVESLLSLSPLRTRNLLRYCLRQRGLPLPSEVMLERILTEVIPARQGAQPLVRWQGGEVRRHHGKLYLLSFESATDEEALGEEVNACVSLLALKQLEGLEPNVQGYQLPRGGQLFISSDLGRMQSIRSKEGEALPRILPLSLSATQWQSVMVGTGQSKDVVRPWNRSPKPLKHWWQEYCVPPWFRKKQPLLYCDDELLLAPGLIVCQGETEAESRQGVDLEKRWVAWWPYQFASAD